MNTADELLDRIAAEPDNIALRLEYADVLAQRGDPRGEFIRIDCEMEDLDESDARFLQLDARRAELLDAHREEWEQPLEVLRLPPNPYGGETWVYRHGFIEECCIGADDYFPDNADRLFAAVPLLREISFADCRVDLEGLAASPHLARLRRLELPRDSIDRESARFLGSSPYLGALRSLDVSLNPLEDAGLRVLLESPSLGPLETLNVNGCELTEAGAEFLAECSRLESLTFLHVGNNDFGPQGAAALAATPVLQNLQGLDVHENGLLDEGLRILAERGRWPLTWINLCENRIGPAGIAAIATASWLNTLTSLDFTRNEIEAEGAVALAAAELSHLDQLDLDANDIAPRGLRALLDCAWIGNVTMLGLAENRLGDDGAVMLAESAALPALVVLRLRENAIGPAGARALARTRLLTSMTRLSLDDNPLGLEGAQALAESETLQSLEFLAVEGLSVEEEGEILLEDRFGDALTLY